jgi:uncharacterized membrane protein YfcA
MIKQKKYKMDINTIIILIIIGFASGVLGGLVGVGGGIIIVPALVFILGFSQLDAQGTSLALIMFPVGLLAVIQYYKQGHVNFNIVFLLAIGFVIGSFLGSKISLSIPQQTVKRIFAILMLVIAIKILFFDNKQEKKNIATDSKVDSH